MTGSTAFHVAFVAGVSPDKWVRRWRDRTPDEPLDLELVPVEDQRAVLDEGRASMAFVRLPIDREGLHLIPLYVEVPVVVLPHEHELTLLDELTLDDLAEEQLVTNPDEVPGFAAVSTVERLAWPEMGIKDAIEVVASGGAVAVLPMSLARLHHRKDVVTRPLLDGPESQVGLAWRRDDDDPRIERFVGIVRGRTEQSSRGDEPAEAPARKKAPAARKPAAKKPAAARPRRATPAKNRRRGR
jgi:LysR substrate binding domain